MKKLRLLLLGSPQVWWGHELLTIQRRIPRALLFYLASNPDLVGRNELLTLFWENQPESVARLRLRETLNKLKRALPEPSLLIAGVNLVGLDLENTYVDLLEFQGALNRLGPSLWKLPANEPIPVSAFGALQQAASLWRSPHFMAGARLPSAPAFDEWLIQIAQQVEHARGQVFERLSDHCLATGNIEGALQYAREALLNDELNERLHERVLSLLVRLDRRGEAHRHFANLQKTLRGEPGAPPALKWVSLSRFLAPGRSSAQATSLTWGIRPSLDLPLLGREEALAQIHHAYAHGGVFFLFGEPGIGKTRLVQEFTWQLQPRPRLMLARCRPTETNLPFQPLIELARNFILPEEWLDLPSRWASLLLPVFPDLAILRPDLEPAMYADRDQERGLIREAIRLLLAGIAQRQRLLIFLDDAQWADEETLATIAYLIDRSPFDRQAFLIAAARREERPAALEGLIRSLIQTDTLRCLQLQGLSPPAIAQLAQLALGAPPSAHLVEQLGFDTGGNPFFVLEILRALLLSQPPLMAIGPAQLPLPESVHKLIHQRLHRLNPLALKALEIAAIVGDEFSAPVISEAGRIPPMNLAHALEELEWHRLVEPSPIKTGDLDYRFIHGKTREVLLRELSPVRMRAYHGRVAQALESSLGDLASQQASTLAEHYQAAGEWTQAYEYWIQAGVRHRQLPSISDAWRAFTKAGTILERIRSQLSDEDIYRLYDPWISTALETHELIALQRLNADLLSLGEQRNSPWLIGVALHRLGDESLVNQDYAQGLAYIEQAIPYLAEAGRVGEKLSALTSGGVLLGKLSRWREGRERLELALAPGADVHDPQVIQAHGQAHFQISLLESWMGAPLRGREFASRALSGWTKAQHPYGQACAYLALALANYFLGEHRQAKIESQTGIELANRAQAWRILGDLHTLRAMIELTTGHITESLAHAQEAIRLGERTRQPELTALGRCRIGDIFARLASPEDALALYQRAEGMDDESLWGMDRLLRSGVELCRLGQPEAGQRSIRQALALAEEHALGMIAIMGRFSLAAGYAATGDHRQAYDLASQVCTETRQRAIKGWNLAACVLLGELAYQAREEEMAWQHFQGAAGRASRLPDPWVELNIHTCLSKIQAKRGPVPSERQQRIETLLDELEANIRQAGNEAVERAFQRFREVILGRG